MNYFPISLDNNTSTCPTSSDSAPSAPAFSQVQQIEALQQQIMKSGSGEGHQVKKARLQTHLDPIVELAILLQQMKQLPAVKSADKFAEAVEKIAQAPVKQQDVPRLLSILHADNLNLI